MPQKPQQLDMKPSMIHCLLGVKRETANVHL